MNLGGRWNVVTAWLRPKFCVNPKIVQNEKRNLRVVAEPPLAAK